MSKKNQFYVIIIALLIFLNFLLAGDGGKIQIGEPVTLISSALISDIYKSPESYLNKYVRIEGTIDSINNNSRCSFILKDINRNLICVQCSGCGYVLPDDLKSKKCIVQGYLHRIKTNSDCENINRRRAALLDSAANDDGLDFQAHNTYIYYLDSIGIIIE